MDASSVLEKRPLKVVHPGEKVPDLTGVADVCLRATEEGPKVLQTAVELVQAVLKLNI